MAQLTYPDRMEVPFPGMIYDLTPHIIESRVSAEASAEIAFGEMVRSDGTEAGVLKITADTQEPQGIVVHSHAYDRTNELGTVGIKPKCQVAIMRKGRIWVLCGNSITIEGRMFYNFTTGKYHQAAVAGQTIDQTGRGYYRTIFSGANGMVVVEVDFTNKA